MNKAQKILALTLVAFASVSVPACKRKKKSNDDDTTQTVFFNFSVGLRSSASTIQIGSPNAEYVQVYDNGVDTNGRSYQFSSTDTNVATIDGEGRITPVAPGRVNFVVTEVNSGIQKALKKEIVVAPAAGKAAGGFNYSGGTSTEELNKRAEILGKLEKYAMDSHLTGITLFDNGGKVRYSPRVKIPTTGHQYVEGYGFGILTEGELNPDLPLDGNDGGQSYPTFYHTSFSQDPLKINQFTATGSQVSDLASHITSSYWSTRLVENDASRYEWYPALAADSIRKPIFDDAGNVDHYEASATANNEPIPAEVENGAKLYRKWRVYVKTDDKFGNLKYTTASSELATKGFNNRGVSIDDYEYIYQFLFTGSNSIVRGTEMANDTSYGIKGAQRFFNETKTMTDPAAIQAKWDEYVSTGKIGVKTGLDTTNNCHYIDIELINAIDSFTAMYTLSSSLTSPLPKDLFVGANSIVTSPDTLKEKAKVYGTFNNGGNNNILNYTLCLGPYTLSTWNKNSEIVFSRNDGWFETPAQGGHRYKIPGVYYRAIDTSEDTEANWKQLEAHNLDSAGVPSSKVETWGNAENVYETKGDATFKLNVNSCTKDQWNKLFGESGTISPHSNWNVKPWMSNDDFLDGLFYSIDRDQFAKKRGVTASVNYFSDSYQMRNSIGGKAYNQYDAHKEAVKGYAEDNGYNFDKATDCFRNAVKQLSEQADGIVLGTRENPTVINIEICWMYQTDKKEYGNDIKAYFERAFNDDSVCGGRVKLDVIQDAVTNWEDVYNERMMKGQFDLGFGAISGNTYNPLNFLEVLKSDNSSGFTLNWGTDTSVVDPKNPIIYDGKTWSFDALWEVADHGGIVDGGSKVDPVKRSTYRRPVVHGGTARVDDLNDGGFDITFDVDFAEFDTAQFDVTRVDLYVFGRGNTTIGEKNNVSLPLTYNKAAKTVKVEVGETVAHAIRDAIKEANGFNGTTWTGDDAWKNAPFLMSQLDRLFSFEIYYELTIGSGSPSPNYTPVTAA